MEHSIKNVLIVGDGAVATSLAKNILKYNPDVKIYVTGVNKISSELCVYVDIRDDNLTELLKFVLDNNIDLTIPISQQALASDIVSFFQSNGQDIFAPSKSACTSFFNKISCKKFLYKLKTQNAKFAIFSKQSQAYEYLNDVQYPVFISTDNITKAQDSLMVCPTIKTAQNFLEKLFLNGETDVIIQEFPYGINFTAYFVTDGYSAVFFNTVRNFKFQKADKSGSFTDGLGCFAPEYRVNNIVISRLQNIAQNILKHFEHRDASYVGFLGIECVLTEDDRFFVMDLKPCLQEHDARAVLNLCEDNILEIMYSCIHGYFSDEYEQIRTGQGMSASVCVYTSKEKTFIPNVKDNDDIDFINAVEKDGHIYTKSGKIFTITKTSSTLSRAKIRLADDIKEIKFAHMHYRKDICDRI